MINKLKKPLAISVVVILAGVILALTSISLPFSGSAQYSVEFSQLWLCMFASVVFAFIYGFIRINRAYAVAIALATLNDLLLGFSLASIASLVIKGVSELPVALVFPIIILLTFVFSFVQSTTVLRSADQLMRTTSRKEKPFAQIADEAPMQSIKSRLTVLVLSLVFLVAVSFGGQKLLAVTVPLMLSAVAVYFTSSCITSKIWAVCASSAKLRK
ncbi:MAG: hypothetical protein Q4E07_00790 [Eubacteriales bacterium]|nr:hypothetical protein [Eubacteriales bacterium]